MKVAVRNVRGCDRADLEWDGICLLAGLNGAGKSSVLQAAACAVTGRLSPVQGMLKKELPMLVRGGTKKASVTVATRDGSVSIEYPGGELSSTGVPPGAHPQAAGLVPFSSLDAKERPKALGSILKTEPTQEDFLAEVEPLGLEKDAVSAVWDIICARGWDAAHDEAKQRCTKLKGAWEGATGENFGAAKAAAWEPEGWSASWAELSAEELAEEVAAAQRALEEAVGSAAVQRSSLETLKELAAAEGARRQDLAGARERLEAAQKGVDAAAKLLEENPSPGPQDGLPCPHCGGLVAIVRTRPGETRLDAVDALQPSELKRRRDAFATADGRHSHAIDQREAAQRAVEAAETALRASEEAKAQIEKGADGADTVAKARTLLEGAQRRASAVEKWRRAHAIRASLERGTKVTALLSDTEHGIRRSKLTRVLSVFNEERAAPVAAAAQWRGASILPDLSVAYGGRPYALLSASEKWRADVVLQVAFASIARPAVMCIDGADILDPDGRNGLFGLLSAISTPSLVAMTLADPESVPDLAAAGLGISYWVTDGVPQPKAQS